MGRSATYTIAYEAAGGEQVDLCRIIFGSDGSYYVTAPYHPSKRAIVGIYEINYAAELNLISLIDGVELAVLQDDARRLKMAHHLDGFLQFSGEGIRSGRDENGQPKGIGLLFTEHDIEHLRRGINGLTVIGHYLPGRWREFVYRDSDGADWVHLAHPNGQAIKRLRVILAPVDASYAGLIGLDAMPPSRAPPRSPASS